MYNKLQLGYEPLTFGLFVDRSEPVNTTWTSLSTQISRLSKNVEVWNDAYKTWLQVSGKATGFPSTSP